MSKMRRLAGVAALDEVLARDAVVVRTRVGDHAVVGGTHGGGVADGDDRVNEHARARLGREHACEQRTARLHVAETRDAA
ncbi:MAG: hypothetical protein ABL998_05600 [Planctomycetota bacterium]